MIIEAIDKYDVENCERHKENTKRLDRLVYLMLGTLLTAAAGVVVDVIIHEMGR